MSTVAIYAVRRRLSRSVATLVAAALVTSSLSLPASAQAGRTAGPGGTQHLIINILEGEGALNNIKQRDAREPVVQVTDENHKPVAGVALVFLIHSGKGGASATFGTNSLTLSTTTDAQGIAHATGLQLGTHAGTFTISVTASVGTMVVATAVIHQSNIIGALSSTASTTSTSTASASTTGTTTTGATSASTGTTASTAGTTASTAGTTVAHHGLLHFLLTPKGIIGGIIVAGAVAGAVVVATQSGGSTGITLGSTTVGHP